MNQGWRRFHLLLVFLTFWKPPIGDASLDSQYVRPRGLRYQETFSNASPIGNAPLEAGSNVLVVKSPSSSQFVGGASSSYESMSQTQSSPSGSVSTSWSLPQNLPKSDSLSSLLQLQGSSSSSSQGMASQSAGTQGSYSQYDFTYKERTGLQPGGPGKLVSTQGGNRFSQAIPESLSELNLASFDVLEQSSGEESLSTASSQSASGLQLGEMSSQLYSQGSGASKFPGASGQQASGSPAHVKLLSSSERLSSQVVSKQGSPSQYTSVSQDSSRLKWSGSSGQFVSAQGGSASPGGLSAQSQSTSSQYAPAYSSPGFSPIAASSPATSDETFQFVSSSDSQGGLSQLAISRLSSLAKGVTTSHVGSYVQSQGNASQLAFGSPQYVSAPVTSQYNQANVQSLSQSQVPQRWQSSSFSQDSKTSGVALSQSRFSAPSAPAPSKSFASVGHPSQIAPASLYPSAPMASPQAVSGQYSQATTGSLSSQSQTAQRWQPSASSFSQGSKTSGAALSQSRVSAPSKTFVSVGRPSQSAPASLYSSASMPSPQSGYSQYSHATDSALSQSQTPQKWQPSVSHFSQGSETSGLGLSQSRFSAPSAPAPSKSLASVGRPSQSAPASLYSSAMPSPQSGYSQYSQTTDSTLSLSQSQAPQRWQPSAPLSFPGFQTSSTVVSQSSPSQGVKFPSRFSLASGSGPSEVVATQEASSSGGLAQSPSTSALHAPAYSKIVSSPSVSSHFASGPSLYASSSPSMAGATLGASRHYASAQRGTGFNIVSLQPQVAAGQYDPAPSLDVKVPAYSQATPSVSSMSPSLQSYTWQSTTSKGAASSFPTSGAAVAQSSSSPQSVHGSSRFPSIAGGTSRLFTQSRGSFSGTSPSVSSVGQYTHGSPAYAKFGVSSQSASGPAPFSQYSQLSTTGAGGQLTSSSGYLSAQGASGSSVGSSVLSQGVLTKDVLAPLDTSMPALSHTAAFQSGSSQSSHASRSHSSLPSLSSNVDSGAASSQMSPGLISFGQPTGFMTQSVQAASEGVFSASSQAQTLSGSAGFGASEGQGMSGGSASVLSGSYDSSIGQGAPASKPSRGSLSRYYGVKG